MNREQAVGARAATGRIMGWHHVVELRGCDPERLRWVDTVREVMLEAADAAGATVVGFAFHQFRPEGASGTLLIAESHFALHTWPEEGYMAMDIFTCGDEMDADVAIEIVRERLGAEDVHVRRIARRC